MAVRLPRRFHHHPSVPMAIPHPPLLEARPPLSSPPALFKVLIAPLPFSLFYLTIGLSLAFSPEFPSSQSPKALKTPPCATCIPPPLSPSNFSPSPVVRFPPLNSPFPLFSQAVEKVGGKPKSPFPNPQEMFVNCFLIRFLYSTPFPKLLIQPNIPHSLLYESNNCPQDGADPH